MAKLRVDQLKMDRRAQVAGGAGLYVKREVDPTTNEEVRRRAGSVQSAAAAYALGLAAPNESAFGYISETFEPSAGANGNPFTIGFSLRVGDIANGTERILHLSGGTSVTLNIVRSSAVFHLILTGATGGGGGGKTADVVAGDLIHVALRRKDVAGNETYRLDVAGDADLTSGDIDLTGGATAYNIYLMGDPALTEAPAGTPSVMSNFVVYNQYASDNSSLMLEILAGTRSTTTAVDAIAAGGYHSLALKTDGSMVSWGYDSNGQVSNTPTTADFSSIASCHIHSLALKTDGSIVSWGSNTYGQVTGTPTGTDFTSIDCGWFHSLALKTDGSIVSWGRDNHGQIGDIPTGTDFVSLAGGHWHSLALKTDGSMVSWGNDSYGQVTNTPSGTDFVSLAGGGFHSLALKTDGSIVAWGYDSDGQVTNTPTGTDFVSIAGGERHSLALKTDGSVVTWGSDASGRGDVPSGTDFVSISAGRYHSMALRADGSMASWGYNVQGQVSDTPTIPFLLYPLDGGLLKDNEGSATAFFGVHPDQPRLAPSGNRGLIFSGHSGAFNVPYSSEFQGFFETDLTSVTDPSWSLYIEAIAVSHTRTLLDFGELIQIEINASREIEVTMNGETATSNAAITLGTSFEIFVGVDDDIPFVYLFQGAAITTLWVEGEVPTTPGLDFRRLYNIYLGADEDSSLNRLIPLALKHFEGSCSTFALWPFVTKRDAGKDGAIFYFDFAAGELTDQGERKVPGSPVVHSPDSARPYFAQGAIKDAPYLDIAGGVALSAAGPDTYAVAIGEALASDVSAQQIGEKVFVSSGTDVHVIDTKDEDMRTLGVPEPGADVTVQAIGAGALDGIYAYGYRFVTGDGTAGPVRRLQAVKAFDNVSVTLGATSTGDDGDNGERDLGVSFGRADKGQAARYAIKDYNSTVSDRLPAGDYSLDCRARVSDANALTENIFERGADSQETTKRGIGFHSGMRAPELNGARSGSFSIAFRFKADTATGASSTSAAQTLISIGPIEGSEQTGGPMDWLRELAVYIQHDGTFDVDKKDRLIIAAKNTSSMTGKDGEFHYKYRYSKWNDWSEVESNDNVLHNDEGFWIDGNDYNLLIQKDANDLRIDVVNVTKFPTVLDNFNPYGGYGAISGATLRAVDTDFFSGANLGGRDYGKNTYRLMYSCPALLRRGKYGNDTCRMSMITSAGNVDSGNNSTLYIHRMLADTIYYHFRAWSAPVNFFAWLPFSWRRDSAWRDDYVYLPGAPPKSGPLSSYITNDVALIHDDLGKTHKGSFYDRAGSVSAPMYWKSTEKNVNSSSTSYDVTDILLVRSREGTGVAEKTAPIMVMGVGGDLEDENMSMAFSSITNGSLLIESPDGYFGLVSWFWDPSNASLNHLALLSDYAPVQGGSGAYNLEAFTWYSIVLNSAVGSETDERRLTFKHFRINGQPAQGGIFSSWLIAGELTETQLAADHLWLGGHPSISVNLAETDFEEFRFWNDDRWNVENDHYDVGGVFEYQNLVGRVREKHLDPINRLRYYAKFQPADTDAEDDDGNAFFTFTAGDEDDRLADYGVVAASDQPARPITATWGATSTRPGLIVDLYDAPGGEVIDDPQPAVAFPTAPHRSITAIEVFRTMGIPIDLADRFDPRKVALALDAARQAPLHMLARIPIGTSRHKDTADDATLGATVSEESGFIPANPVGVFTWMGQLGLFEDNRTIHFGEPGPYGWESFPTWLQYSVPIKQGSGAIRAATEIGGRALLLGRSWATLLAGSPSQPEPMSLGTGVGAESPRCLTTYGSQAFAFNGTLWAISGGEVMDFGQAVQSALPDAANCRLATSAELASLLVIDVVSGEVLRYHFPTEQWTIESRDVVAAGDLSSGTCGWVHVKGAHSIQNSNIYSDNMASAGDNPIRTGTLTGPDISWTGALNIPAQHRVAVLSSDNTTLAVYRTTNVTDSAGVTTIPLTPTPPADSGTLTFLFGTSKEGLLLDTGMYHTPDEAVLREVDVDSLASANWQVGVRSSDLPGERGDISAISFVAVASNADRPLGAGTRGLYHQAVIRNLVPKAARLGFIEMDITQ